MLAALAFFAITGRTIVLTYHDMVPKRDKNALWFDCTPAELESQLKWMESKGAHFISTTQLYDHLAKGKILPKKPVAITFADNYEGFWTYAVPILRKHHVPVTMFVHTDYVGNQQGRPKMTWEQLGVLDKDPLFTIASQTRTHPADLRQLSDAQLNAEFKGSKLALEKRLGHPVRFVAYPNGKWDDRVARFARQADYQMAFTEVQTYAEKAKNLWLVPRSVHTRYKAAFGLLP